METEEYSIATLELKAKELKNSVLKLGYEILDKIDKGEIVEKELIAEQKLKANQYNLFSKMINQMKKANPNSTSGNLSSLIAEMQQVALGVAKIQQQITHE